MLRKRYNSERSNLQVGEVVSPLKGGRLDTRDFIFPEIQMLQLRQLLKKAVRFDLVQFIVAQQPGVNIQIERNVSRTKNEVATVEKCMRVRDMHVRPVCYSTT